MINVKYSLFWIIFPRENEFDIELQLLNVNFPSLYNFNPIYNIKRKDKHSKVIIVN